MDVQLTSKIFKFAKVIGKYNNIEINYYHTSSSSDSSSPDSSRDSSPKFGKDGKEKKNKSTIV